MSVLVIYEILGVFVDALTADDKYSFHNKKNLPQLITLQLFKKQFFFVFLFAPYLKYTSKFEYFGKKMTLIGYVFSKLETVKNVS